MDDILYNPYTIAIVGGAISTVIGGLILGALTRKSTSSNQTYIPSYAAGQYQAAGKGCLTTIYQAALFGLINLIAIIPFPILMTGAIHTFLGSINVTLGQTPVNFLILIAILFYIATNAVVIADLFYDYEIVSNEESGLFLTYIFVANIVFLIIIWAFSTATNTSQ